MAGSNYWLQEGRSQSVEHGDAPTRLIDTRIYRDCADWEALRVLCHGHHPTRSKSRRLLPCRRITGNFTPSLYPSLSHLPLRCLHFVQTAIKAPTLLSKESSS